MVTWSFETGDLAWALRDHGYQEIWISRARGGWIGIGIPDAAAPLIVLTCDPSRARLERDGLVAEEPAVDDAGISVELIADGEM